MLDRVIHHSWDDVGRIFWFSEHEMGSQGARDMVGGADWSWLLFFDVVGSVWIRGVFDLVFSRSHLFKEPFRRSEELR